MATSDTVSICVVGASGLIGIRHTEHCLESPLVKLSCIIDPMPAGVELANKHGLKHFLDVDAMLTARAKGDVKVEGAILATPNATHVPLGIKLVQAGIHVLVEKPFATTAESGRHLVAEAENAGRKILVGHHRRFNGYATEAKNMIDSGKLGRVLAVQGTWTLLKPPSYFEGATAWRTELGSGGTILINLVHELDLLRYFCGDVIKVYCQRGPSTRGFPVEETGSVVLTFASGTVGTFIFSDATASPHSWEGATGENPNIPYTGGTAYTFFGTQGTVSVPDLKLYHYEKPNGCWNDSLASSPSPDIDSSPPLARQLEHFVQVCKEIVEPRCSGLEGLKNIILLETITQSMTQGLPLDVPQT